ncbi:hypothetical protein NDU88_005288 [Pleurodeles waltl]|uniref:Uncharacterized protein n=1 Tax=Pleurodeles waltl TaxID=8319 RepID=A0AAV7VLC0_PLEWA|nr:hypothetical protein NDU88_005288 [Pleurodeles waltl]
MTNIAFDPSLELRKDGTSKPLPIIACLLRHGQARQLLLGARAHGPFKMDSYEIRITADFSKEKNNRRKGFLALRPRMRQLEVKYGLCEPARLWVSKDFYDSEDLPLYLDNLQPQSMNNNPRPAPVTTQCQAKALPLHQLLRRDQTATTPTIVLTVERLAKTHDARGQVLQAVVLHTQLSDRDKSHSPLKPIPAPT